MRTLFLEAVEGTTPLFADPGLAARFDDPSALAEFSVRGLAGHLLRAMTSVEVYLDRTEPHGPPISAVAYYAAVVPPETNIGDEIHRAIRRRGEDAASGGPVALAAAWGEAVGRLGARLAVEAPVRLVRVYQDLVLPLDDYLQTRLVELCVHADDLASSLGVDPPRLPDAATATAIATLVGVARLRHTDTAVLRALTRRERDAIRALQVM